jgi:hypothetical protein
MAVTLAAMPVAAAAQEPTWEITPLVRFDGSDYADPGWGVAFGRGQDTGLRVEAVLESVREDSFVRIGPGSPTVDMWRDADSLSLQLGLSRRWVGPTFYPFATFAGGIRVVHPDAGPVEYKGYAVASVGGGLGVSLSETWQARFDARLEWVGWTLAEYSDGTLVGKSKEVQGVLRLGVGARF